jgi:hypothetical protein
MNNAAHGSSYRTFFAMIATSTLIMFGLMYFNTHAVDHIRFSETRTYMAIYMGSIMSIIMLLFMWGMYKNKITNITILIVSAFVFVGSLWLVRSQTTVQDQSWMKAMIPHHSIAILTSSRAEIEDVRVRQLADEIIAAQKREIAEMEWLIEDIARNGPVAREAEATNRPVPDFTAK